MSFKTTIIGTGNVASQLARELNRRGHVINEIYARTGHKPFPVSATTAQPVWTTSLDFSASSSSLFIMAISDNAIEIVASEILLPRDALLVHTSGTVPMSALEKAAHDRIGVFYPLQSFTRKRNIEFCEVPLLIEASDADCQRQLELFAASLSNTVRQVSSGERLNIHLAAVFANNFTNHMIAIANRLMHNNALDTALLEPLIRETIDKALDLGPASAQTGPAIRNDTQTIQKHLQLLDFNPDYRELYRVMSNSIRNERTKL